VYLLHFLSFLYVIPCDFNIFKSTPPPATCDKPKAGFDLSASPCQAQVNPPPLEEQCVIVELLDAFVVLVFSLQNNSSWIPLPEFQPLAHLAGNKPGIKGFIHGKPSLLQSLAYLLLICAVRNAYCKPTLKGKIAA
jgi:hypothetical protein